MARVRSNFWTGTLSSQLLSGATTLMSSALATFPTVSGGDVAYLVIDADGSTPEIVKVTAHTSGATTATIVRGQDSTTDRTWASGTAVAQNTIASDLDTDIVTSVDGSTGAVDLSGTYASVFNVAGYGATGDGSTDDTAAVQAAIDAAEANNGGTVYFPPGRYLVSALTVNVKGVALVGAGASGDTSGATTYGTVVKSSGSGALITISAGKCAVRNLRLDGSATASACLVLDGAAQSFVESLHVTAAAIGIKIGTSANSHACMLRDIFVQSCTTQGIVCLTNGYDTEASNVWIGECQVGLRVESGAQFFSNLHVWGSTGNGVEVRSDANRFANVYIETNGGNGLDFSAAKYNRVTGGVLRANTSYGAGVASSSHRNGFSNLAVYNNGLSGIRIGSGDYCQINGCNMFDDQGTKTQDYGVQITATPTGTVVVGCVSRSGDHATGGISDAGTGTTTAGNVTT